MVLATLARPVSFTTAALSSRGSLRDSRVAVHDHVADHQVEDGIAQNFQALVVFPSSSNSRGRRTCA